MTHSTCTASRRVDRSKRLVAAILMVMAVASCAAPGDDTPAASDSAQQRVAGDSAAAGAATSAAAADTLWLLAANAADDAIRIIDSEAALVARYGAANVIRAAVDEGEGMLVPGTVIFPGDSMRRLEIQWSDTVAYRTPSYVTAVGRAWMLHPGVRYGTTLRELERLNGGPFEVSGFGGHSPGSVTDWRGGALAQAFADGRLMLRLQPAPPYPPGASTEPYDSENLFLSSDAGMQLLNPRVVSIVVRPR